MKPGTAHTKLLHHLSENECKTTDVLADELGFNRRQISDAARGLIMRGLIERVEIGCYQLTPLGLNARCQGLEISSGPIGPRRNGKWRSPGNTLRQKAWRAMRRMVTFTISDVLVLAQSGSEKSARSNIEQYIRDLNAAGYVQELQSRVRGTAPGSNGYKRFRLLKDTGEFAPIVRSSRSELFDRNLDEVLSW